ncbi:MULTISPECIES: LysM peptidoglycan-binding domain-containing protein [unclassified Methylobacterium]|uniref:LysM peptidoglycan-binding domain-containing protein n=1 Tax=unclassified Methylobacterium TaxID=2615210 RepID=UPI00135586F6|nr:LysM peptidoglycan-binding domain-containing protein [Methylobacterium sp. 2A]MWV21150.1 LysM peptidoglycan-binding domain-containing protein [Methylobacterium sp. 2A]
MSGQVRRSLALALVGLLGGLGLVAALFGGESLRQLTGRSAQQESEGRALASRQDPSIVPSLDRRDDKPVEAGAPARVEAPSGAPGDARPAGSAKPATAAPRFDIVRVEPNGDAVVAGQGAPDAVVELLVNGKPVARATADAGGQFAVVPPALPAGSSQIRLRMTGKDGRAAESEQSVAVEVAPGRDRQPLVALTAPDAATLVLSQPGAPGSRAAAAAASGAPGPGQPTRIASVDVQENGRLFVTATGTPGAALRLYLNDTLIAPGRVGPDGRASFTIGRGMKPGPYRVRIDQIDPATGKVEARAEVPLAVPEPTRMAARDPAGSHPVTVRDKARTNAPTNSASNTPAGARTGGGQGGATGSTRATPDRAEATPPQGPAQTSQAQTSAVPDPRLMAAEAGADAADGAVYVPEINTAKITRGDNLWRISQRTYGRGERYTVIYDANQTQIRDPDLIYPGQIFVLPADKRG